MKDVAIVGMAGCFPGAADLEAFWRLLIEGRDAVVELPSDRWDPAEVVDPVHDVPTVGAYLDAVDLFDAAFFGVSPREASVLDPQQSLILEAGWSALEDAGQRARDLRGSRTGVYVGAIWHDHELLRKEHGEPTTRHSIVGNAIDIVAARLSYHLGLRGPSLVVGTGCSSSLVALHLACRALDGGEIDAALVGGANVILSPDVTIGLTHFGGLSPTGRCRPFGAGADGFVRGEGVVAVYVKTLERALADGDPIRAVIVGSAVNNDGGGTSLVTPNADAQQELLRELYGPGRVAPASLAYVEAHGTGTARGDAAEATSLGRVLGAPAGRRLPIGSVKSNIGHLETAAGLAGLVKAVLALEHGVVPPSLNAERLNPDIDFAGLGLDVVRAPLALPAGEHVRVGVNSFGWGGTNAHVVLARPPASAAAGGAGEPDRGAAGGPGRAYLLPVSAHNEPALRRRVADVLDHIDAGASGAGTAHALAWHRDHFAQREAVVVNGGVRTSVTGRARAVGRVAFVFPGQGAQWQAMGAGLYGHDTAFTASIDRCGAALRAVVDWDLRALVTGELGRHWLGRVDMVQPALWAMSVSLAAAWQDAGVRPDLVIGHSQGEIAAATVAGALSHEDGAMVVARRSAVLREVAGRGRMLAVDLDPAAAVAALDGFEATVALAVHNGPGSCVLSGESDSVLLLREILEADGVFCRLVEVDYASHSPQIDPLLEPVRAALAGVHPRRAAIPVLSTVEVRELDGTGMDAGYWATNLRSRVRFAEAIGAAVDAGVTHVVEVSPHPGLAPALGRLADERAEPPAVLTTLRRDEGTHADLLRAFGRAYVSGLDAWGARPPGRPSAVPPPYPWQRERHRSTATGRRRPARGGRLELPLTPAPSGGSWLAMTELSLDAHPWLADHRVGEACMFPAGGYLAMAGQSLAALSGGRPVTLREVTLPAALPTGTDAVRLSASWRAATGHAGQLAFASLTGTGPSWTTHCRLRADWGADPAGRRSFPAHLLDVPATEADELYRAAARRELHYGPAFRVLAHAHDGGAEVLARLTPSRAGGATARWDGILQPALLLVPAGQCVVPTAIGEAVLFGPADGELWVHARRSGEHTYDLVVFDADRAPVGHVDGLVLAPLLDGAAAPTVGDVHRLRFVPVPAPERGRDRKRVVCGSSPVNVAAVAAVLADASTVLFDRGTPVEIPACESVVFVAPCGLEAQRAGLTTLARLVAHLIEAHPAAELTVLTCHAHPAPDGSRVDVGSALYAGFTTVLQSEHPQLRTRLVDVDVVTPALRPELDAAHDEDLVLLREDRRYAGRRERGGPAPERPAPWRTGALAQPFRIGAARPGRLDTLRPRPLLRRAPAPGEVEVEVEATSVNFVDVMKAMGVYPDHSAGADLLGLDAAGTVVAVGPDVTGVVAGDRVIACGLGMLASHATVDARHVLPMPAGLTPAQACALPMVLVTAWYALVDLAGVAPGETVLVHSAAGGLGLAAIAVARHRGATVLATAGTEAKRAHLRGLGIEHVFDSRGLEWGAGVRVATAGRGVDVVVNSLAGAAIPLGLDVLAEDGRFVELGKRDIYADVAVELGAFRKAVSFSAVDIAGLLRRRPDRFAELLRTVIDRVADRSLAPLPVTEHPVAAAESAFRTMAAGEHIGKIVLTRSAPDAIAVVPDPRVRAGATYLITGGLGALGLSLAEYLADTGAGAVALLGRSAPTPAAAARVAALRERGVEVGVWRADVADESRMSQVLAELRASMPPLHGVFHAAGVLDDATVPQIDAAQVRRVLGPKVEGALVLDRLTAGDPLDLFVLFSSVAAYVGTTGQAVYAAANAALDALAARRRRSGRAGLSIQWGPIEGVGLAASRADRGGRLADRGMAGMPVAECWPALWRYLEAGETVLAHVGLDARRWVQTYPAMAAAASWRPILATATDAGGGPGGALGGLRELPAEVRRGRVEEAVRKDAASVLMIEEHTLERERDVPLQSLGLDSLMAIELRNRLESSLGIRLSPTLLWKHGSLARLCPALSDLLDQELARG
jgi:phthiocerol/phenolphthiocerol synthesis type-I polyketide synthase C